MAGMGWFDILVIIVLAASFIGGLWRGAARNLSSLIATIIGVPLAGLAYRWLAGLLSFLPGANWENFLGFYITYGVIFAAVFLILHPLRKKLGETWSAGFLYRLFGGVFGLVSAMIGFVVLALVIGAFPIFGWLERWLSGSEVVTSLVRGFGFIGLMLPQVFRRATTMT
jgi:uncharacterized membrane protein required for colicin V production